MHCGYFFLFNLIHCCKAAIEDRYQSSMSRFRYRVSPPIERQGNLTCVYHLANAGSVTSIDWLTASEAFNVVHLRSAATMYCDALKYLSRPADCARGDQHSHVYNECSQHISTHVPERKMTAETCALILGPEQCECECGSCCRFPRNPRKNHPNARSVALKPLSNTIFASQSSTI